MNKLYFATFGLILGLTGCVTTADYSDSVLRLEKAITDSAISIEAIDADITTRRNAKIKKEIIDGTLLLDTKEEECAAGKEECSLEVAKKIDNGQLETVSDYPVKSNMPKGIKALNQVKIYVGRLKSIVEAETAAKITASANATLGSLEDIANQIAKESGKTPSQSNKITEYKEPVMGLVEWITNKYIDRVKKDALSKATREAHPIIKDLTVFYATSAQSQKLAEFSGFHDAFVKRQEEFDDKNKLLTSNIVDAYVLDASNYDVALKAQTANPLKTFEAAHEKLMYQLNDQNEKKTSLAEVSATIEQLEQEAKKIKELVDSFKKTNSTNNGG